MTIQIVLVVLAQFHQAGSSHVEEFQLHLAARPPVLRSLNDILFAATSGLHHLVDRAVAIGRKKALTEYDGELIERVAFAIGKEILPKDRLAQDLATGVVVHGAIYYLGGFLRKRG